MIEQVGIVVFGMSAVVLSQDARPAVRRWACVCGLMAQPFWFYTTASNGQWGIFACSFVYAYGWARGFWNFWIRKRAA